MRTLQVFAASSTVLRRNTRCLDVVHFACLFFTVARVLLTALQDIRVINVTFQLSYVTLLIGYSVGCLLVFNRFKFPRLNVHNTTVNALATHVLRIVILLICLFHDTNGGLKLRFSGCFRISPILAGSCLGAATPVLIAGKL